MIFTEALNSSIANNRKKKKCKIYRLHDCFISIQIYHEETALEKDRQADVNRPTYYCSKRKREHARLPPMDLLLSSWKI